MVRTDRSAADDAGARELLAAALDAVAAPARRDERASTRVVRGTPRHIWDVVTGELFGRARYEYVGFDDPSVLVANGLTESMLACGSAAMREMLGRGVRLRQLTTGSGLAASSEDHPAIQFRLGGQARVVSALPFKACVFDRRIAAIPLDLSSLLHGMVVTADPLLVRMVLGAHRIIWNAGTEPGDTLPPHLQTVLDLLASGVPDDRAARQAGLSPRTYSRRIAELMDLLGARSRFEAGIVAARRGWTPPAPG